VYSFSELYKNPPITGRLLLLTYTNGAGNVASTKLKCRWRQLIMRLYVPCPGSFIAHWKQRRMTSTHLHLTHVWRFVLCHVFRVHSSEFCGVYLRSRSAPVAYRASEQVSTVDTWNAVCLSVPWCRYIIISRCLLAKLLLYDVWRCSCALDDPMMMSWPCYFLVTTAIDTGDALVV